MTTRHQIGRGDNGMTIDEPTGFAPEKELMMATEMARTSVTEVGDDTQEIAMNGHSEYWIG